MGQLQGPAARLRHDVLLDLATPQVVHCASGVALHVSVGFLAYAYLWDKITGAESKLLTCEDVEVVVGL